MSRNNDKRLNPSTIVFGIYLLLLPISTALSGIIGTVSLLNYIAVIYILFSLMELLYYKTATIFKSTFAIYVYMLYSLISCIWGAGFSLNYYFVTFAISFAILLCSTTKRYSPYEVQWLHRMIVLSSVTVIVATILNIHHFYAGRIVITLSSTMDPNDFGCGTCIIFAALLMKLYEEKKGRMITMLLLIGVLVAVILTGSRGALLMCIVEFVAWLLLFMKKSRGRIVLLAILVVAAIYVFSGTLSNELTSRLSLQAVLSSGGTGRVNIWKAAISKFCNSDFFHMLFGYGHGSFATAVNYHGGGRDYAYMSHNMYINVMIEGGIIGTVLLLLAIYQCLRLAKKNLNYCGLISIVGFSITALSLDVQSYRIFPIAFAVAMIFNNPQYYRPRFRPKL